MEISKITKNNGKLTIKEIDYELAKKICIENHYSKKWNTSFGKLNFGIYQDDNNECMGVLVFGNLMNPSSYKSISDELNKDGVIELNRMWLSDELGKNSETTCLAMSFKYMKKYKPEIKVVQTFADGRLGCGTVYKASNFKYFGKHETQFFEDIFTKEVFHKVSLENTRKLNTMIAKNLVLANNRLRPFRVYTYRYLYILDKKLNKSLKLKELPYPEYNKGVMYNDEYKHGIRNLARVWLSLTMTNSFKYELKLIEKFILTNYNYQLEELKELALNSKTMREYYYDSNEAIVEYIIKGLPTTITKNNLQDSIYN